MLVYHDWSFDQGLGTFARRCRDYAASHSIADIDECRRLLIGLGQLEQGYFDSLPPGHDCVEDEIATSIKRLTDEAASAFWACFGSDANTASKGKIEQHLCTILELLEGIQGMDTPRLMIKVSEGLAFYSLFPEQYCASALKWSVAHQGMSSKRVFVLGIRSIGTTLSAVVAAVLKAHGWKVTRSTVRPTGHPFRRKVERSAPELSGIKCALIVDEGPGLSGSSMMAGAEWVREAGVREIALLPGHDNGPGSSATSEVQRWWELAERYFTPLEEVKWEGRSISEWLCARFGLGTGASVTDLSGGKWRGSVFAKRQSWPAVCTRLERMKFKIDGVRSVLCKFEGLGCLTSEQECALDSAWKKWARLADAGFAPQPIGIGSGFLVTPWIEGQRLSRQDANEEILALLARYLVSAARPPLSRERAEAAHERLADMLYWNTKEALGEELADASRRSAEFVEEPQLTYGDGRMAPYEWVRTPEKRKLKTDCAGHDCDHTLIGRQSIVWDIAGTIVEWDLNEAQQTCFLSLFDGKKIELRPDVVSFYCAAYAAFRVGVMSLANSENEGNEAESNRIAKAFGYYKQKLLTWLSAVELMV